MFVDSADLSGGGTMQADLCLVGAGAAGIALALEFIDTPIQVVVLEGGGLMAEPNGRGIYQVIPRFPSELSVDASRGWYFGGNTNHWNAHCRPLDAGDFTAREWIAHSGWPISRQQLVPYYERAQAVCGLCEFHWYDLEACRPHLQHPPLDVDPATLASKVVQTCPVQRFADLYRHRLAAAENVRVVLHARALRLETNAASDHVRAVEFAAKDGRRMRAEAGRFVLAVGGIENARLLLCSNAVRGNGLGNDHDLVGRFFMEHWYVDIPLGRWADAHDLDFYDVPQPVGAARAWGHLVLSEEIARRERMAGLSLWIRRLPSVAPSSDGMVAFMRKRAQLRQPLTDLLLALNHPGNRVGLALAPLGGRGAVSPLRKGYVARVQLEQAPDRENRIRLSLDRDRRGQPEAAMTLRLTDAERRSHLRALRIVGAVLGLDGKRLARQLQLRLDAGRYGFFMHHMGTTRMHRDPRQGVVDADCRVHGISNLFVAGSSVFPTGGTAAPTLTIIALALRLADHLRYGYGVSACR